MPTNICTRTGACIECTGQPALDPVPAHNVVDPNPGWNAGARSRRVLTGDCYTRFSPDYPSGVVLGFQRFPHGSVSNPMDVSHGFFLFAVAGLHFWQVIEHGAPLGEPQVRLGINDEFTVVREGLQVSYLVNGAPVYVSELANVGPICVTANLYVAGDHIQ